MAISLGLLSFGSGLVFLEDRFAGEAYAEFAKNLTVHFGEHHGGMHLTASEFGKFLKGTPATFVSLGENGESHKHLVGVKPRVVASEIFGLRFLNRLYHLLRNQLHAVVDSGKMLCGVKNQRRTRTEQLRGF